MLTDKVSSADIKKVINELHVHVYLPLLEHQELYYFSVCTKVVKATRVTLEPPLVSQSVTHLFNMVSTLSLELVYRYATK